MKEPTKKEMLELVDFQRNVHGKLYVHTVKGDIFGNVEGNVKGYVNGCVGGDVGGSIGGSLWGTISGRRWQYAETIVEQIIRLIREGNTEEAINMLAEID